MRANLEIGDRTYRLKERTAFAAMTVLRSSPRFLYLVAWSLFLGSSGLLLMASLKACELKSETNVRNASTQITALNNVAMSSVRGDDR